MGSMVLIVLVTGGGCACVCIFIKLDMAAQSGPVILVILRYSTRIGLPEGAPMVVVTKTPDKTQQRLYVCVFVCVCIDQIAHSSAQYGRILFPSDCMLQYSQWSSKGGIDGICCREN